MLQSNGVAGAVLANAGAGSEARRRSYVAGGCSARSARRLVHRMPAARGQWPPPAGRDRTPDDLPTV